MDALEINEIINNKSLKQLWYRILEMKKDFGNEKGFQKT